MPKKVVVLEPSASFFAHAAVANKVLEGLGDQIRIVRIGFTEAQTRGSLEEADLFIFLAASADNRKRCRELSKRSSRPHLFVVVPVETSPGSYPPGVVFFVVTEDPRPIPPEMFHFNADTLRSKIVGALGLNPELLV